MLFHYQLKNQNAVTLHISEKVKVEILWELMFMFLKPARVHRNLNLLPNSNTDKENFCVPLQELKFAILLKPVKLVE